MLKSSNFLKILLLILACLITSVVVFKKWNKYQKKLTMCQSELIDYKMLIKQRIPNFILSNVKGKFISNKDYEFSEQRLLYEFLDENDVVLQLGGNIGTSCILADKILNKKDKQLCVEPNNETTEVLQKNKKLNNSKFNIISGIISNKICSYKKNQKEDDDNKVGVTFIHGNAPTESNKSDIKCYDYSKLEEMIADKINVLFLDCEGCACDFFDMYENVLPNIDTIFIEQDMPHICNYKKVVDPVLKKHNFKQKIGGFHQVWTKK